MNRKIKRLINETLHALLVLNLGLFGMLELGMSMENPFHFQFITKYELLIRIGNKNKNLFYKNQNLLLLG